MKKKMVAILICGVLVFSFAGCKTSETEDETEESADKETEKTTEESADKEVEKTATESADKGTKESTEEPVSINLGEQVEVNAEYGDFLLTVDDVRESDWYSYFANLGLIDAEDLVAILLECNVDNTGYKDPSSNIFELKDYINVTDNEGRKAEYFGYALDDGDYELLAELEIGENGGIVVPFACEPDAQSLTININDQYVLEAQIENGSDEEEGNDSSEYGLEQLVGYNSLISLPEGSPVTVSGIAYEVSDGIYVMGIFTADNKDLNANNLEEKSIYVLDPINTQSYDKKYISVNGHTDLSYSMPAVMAESISDESESYLSGGGTLPE